MKNIVIFEGANEVIVGSAASVNGIIRDWFLNGGRSLDDYDVYLVDGSEGFSLNTTFVADGVNQTEFDVTELMPNDLRENLIRAGLLTDE